MAPTAAWISIPASGEQILMTSAPTAHYAAGPQPPSSYYGSSMLQTQNVGGYPPRAFNAISAQYLYDPASMCVVDSASMCTVTDQDVSVECSGVVDEDAEATLRLEMANRRYMDPANEESAAVVAAISPVSVVELEYASSSSTSTPSAAASVSYRPI
uniref:Uncharacterized protein n=1 Tax=Romanomermis culicivorax TaxID=13658 RepID=A0A915KZF6_ROMCU